MTCGKGWAERCAHSKGRRCRCQCGGSNHGRFWTDQQVTLEQAIAAAAAGEDLGAGYKSEPVGESLRGNRTTERGIVPTDVMAETSETGPPDPGPTLAEDPEQPTPETPMPLRPKTPMPADPYVAGAVDAIREWLEAVPPQDLRRVVCAGLLVPLAEEQLAAMGYNLEGKLVGYDLAAQDWLAVLPDTEQTVDGCLCIECRTIRMKREQNSHAD